MTMSTEETEGKLEVEEREQEHTTVMSGKS